MDAGEEYLEDLIRQRDWFQNEVDKNVLKYRAAKTEVDKAKYKKILTELLGRLGSFKKELEDL